MDKNSDANSGENKFSNFLVNTSNQANLADLNDVTAYQINSVFIFINPYCLESFEMEDVPGLEINVDEKGSVWLNDEQFELIEVKPGIAVFGIVKQDKEKNL